MGQGGDGVEEPSIISTFERARVTVGKAASASRIGATLLADSSSSLVISLLSKLLTAVLVFAVSVFMYGTFYYAYMPLEINNLPVNLQFKPCPGQTSNRCSYPTASVALTRKQKLLQGQPYTIHMTLVIPDSPVNEDHGMFMSCMNMSSSAGETIANSCKSAVAEYRSPQLRTMETLFYSVFLLTGITSQKQNLNLLYFTNFHPDPHTPTELINIEVQSNNIQVASALLHIEASLTGLRHLMYRHSWLASILGVGTNILIIATVIAVSWARFNQSQEESTESEETEDEAGEDCTNCEDKEESVSVQEPTDVETSSIPVQVVATDSSPKAGFLVRLRWFVISSLFKLVQKIIILTIKLAAPLVLVTACYEVVNLGYEDPQLVIDAGKEDLLFLAVYIKEKVILAIENFNSRSVK